MNDTSYNGERAGFGGIGVRSATARSPVTRGHCQPWTGRSSRQHGTSAATTNQPGTHALLCHLTDIGFDGAPRFIGIDSQKREVLSYILGTAVTPPYPDWALTDEALVSVAELLRAITIPTWITSCSAPVKPWRS
jgi:hypothetical protein